MKKLREQTPLLSSASVRPARIDYGPQGFVLMEIGSDSAPLPTVSNNRSSCLAQLARARAASSLLLKSAYRNAKHYSEKPRYYTGQAAFHLLDFLRILLVIQTLMSRFLYQLFNVYDSGSALESVQIWGGWPIIVFATIAAITAKSINHISEYRGKKYPGAQNYIFTLVSSSVLYLGYDAVNGGRTTPLPRGYFIATSILVPFMSILASKFVIPDSENRVTLRKTDENKDNFPAYPNASQAERAINVLTGVSYGLFPLVFFWALNRELNSGTVDLEYYQMGVAALIAAVYGVAGYFLTSAPKVFHVFSTIGRTINDGALAYGALSAIAFESLKTANNQLNSNAPSWSSDTEDKLSIGLPMLALAVALFAGATHLLQYKKEHDNTVDFLNSPTKISAAYNTATASISNYFGGLFSYFHRSSANNDSSSNDASASNLLDV